MDLVLYVVMEVIARGRTVDEVAAAYRTSEQAG